MFYQEKFQAAGIRRKNFRRSRDLTRFPFTTKEAQATVQVEEVVVVVPVVDVGVVVLMLFCNCTVRLVGGLMPSVCDLSRLTCMTATSISTSGRARFCYGFPRQCHLIGRAADDNRPLRRQLLNTADFENCAHRVDHILQFGRLRKI